MARLQPVSADCFRTERFWTWWRRHTSYDWCDFAAGFSLQSGKSMPMQSETRLERRLDRAVARAITPRGAAIVIASASIVITFGSAFLMTLADHDHYQSFGSGLWWAVQTVTTVGYGDVTPVTVSGRLVAAFVMLVGIGFLTVITAAITSTFVSRTGGRAGTVRLRGCDGGAAPWDRRSAGSDRSRTAPFPVVAPELDQAAPPIHAFPGCRKTWIASTRNPTTRPATTHNASCAPLNPDRRPASPLQNPSEEDSQPQGDLNADRQRHADSVHDDHHGGRWHREQEKPRLVAHRVKHLMLRDVPGQLDLLGEHGGEYVGDEHGDDRPGNHPKDVEQLQLRPAVVDDQDAHHRDRAVDHPVDDDTVDYRFPRVG